MFTDEAQVDIGLNYFRGPISGQIYRISCPLKSNLCSVPQTDTYIIRLVAGQRL
jgi:hypothetical protein